MTIAGRERERERERKRENGLLSIEISLSSVVQKGGRPGGEEGGRGRAKERD